MHYVVAKLLYLTIRVNKAESFHSFSWYCISIHTGSAIPQIVVSKAGVLEHNGNITLICNISERGDQVSTALTSISWLKDGVALSKSTRYPVDLDSFPLVLQELKESDNGNYTCVVQALLRHVLKYNVTDYILIEVEGL